MVLRSWEIIPYLVFAILFCALPRLPRLATSRLTSHTRRSFQGKTGNSESEALASSAEGAREPRRDERRAPLVPLVTLRLYRTFPLAYISLSLENSFRVTCESTCSKSTIFHVENTFYGVVS